MSVISARAFLVSLINAVLFSFIIAAGAQLDIDIAGILPLTGQTLVILTGALFLPPQQSFGAVMIYLLMGITGLPVYAEGNSGWLSFSGPSLGYFIGFLIAATAISFRRKLFSRSLVHSFTALFLGHLVVLSLGSVLLTRYYSLADAFTMGFQAFILGALFKSVLGALIYFSYKTYFTRAQ